MKIKLRVKYIQRFRPSFKKQKGPLFLEKKLNDLYHSLKGYAIFKLRESISRLIAYLFRFQIGVTFAHVK